MSGCDRDEGVITPMWIRDIQIHVSDIDTEIKEITMYNERLELYGSDFVGMNPKYYAVTILVYSGYGGCTSYHQTRLFQNSDENEVDIGLITGHNEPWIWQPHDTIILKITQSEPKPDGSFDCPAISYDFFQAIFIGFCIPGEYTLLLNSDKLTFTINASDGTVHIH